jgi:hypothetical protein
MRRIRKKPNVARLSGYKPSEVGEALKDFGGVGDTVQPAHSKPLKAKSEEERLRLKAAGYRVEDS